MAATFMMAIAHLTPTLRGWGSDPAQAHLMVDCRLLARLQPSAGRRRVNPPFVMEPGWRREAMA